MKTATIAWRVADFLRKYPPFQYMDDTELLELVADGRVLFHEDGEYVFEQGRTRGPRIFVIQQGMVRLVEIAADGSETLRDVRGEGDLLGMGRYLGINEYICNARTETDCILYALDAERFWTLVKRHPRASRFLAVYFSATMTPPGLEARPELRPGRAEALRIGHRPLDWMAHSLPPRPPPTCTPTTPLREAASRLASSGAEVLAVIDGAGRPLGVITPRLLSDQVASGKLSPNAPARLLMQPVLAVAAPGAPVGHYLTAMLNEQSDHLVLTRDGTSASALLGVIGRSELACAEGAAPLMICDQMARADHIGALARLRQEGEAALAAGLTGPDAIRWLAPIAGAFHAAVLRRVVGLVEGALAAEGLGGPDLDHCWVFFGSAARHELMTRHDLDHGLVYDEAETAIQRKAARAYYLELGRRVSAGLAACGYSTSTKAIVAGHPSACRSVVEWERAFSQWVSDPVESCVYRATSFFDLRPIHGDCRLVDRLAHHTHDEVARNPGFVPLLVSDSMANLPPLTFFRGLVIDDEGAYTEVLDLQRATLQPVTDIARALALDCQLYQATATLERLRALAPENGEAAVLIKETATAFRTALYHRARTGFATGTEGSRVDPTKLTRLEQSLLKTGFRTVLRLMEYMGGRYGIALRR